MKSSLRSFDTVIEKLSLDNKWLVLWLCIAMVSLLAGVHYPYYGEEGQYTIPIIEMLFNHQYFAVTTYGNFYWRPPLFNWLMLPWAHSLGIQHILSIARIITITSVIGSSIVLACFVQRLLQQTRLALLSALFYFNGILLFRISWIAYADPLFSFFCVIALCSLWLGCKENRIYWFVLACAALFCAFLTKALTSYFFYAVTATLLLYFKKEYRPVFWRPAVISLHVISFALPFIWINIFLQDAGTMNDIVRQLNDFSFLLYVKKILLTPVDVFLKLFPLSVVVAYCFYRLKKGTLAPIYTSIQPTEIKILGWIILVNFLPYYFSFKLFVIRYLMPLLPFIAFWFASLLTIAGNKMLKIGVLVILIELFLKLTTGFIGLPWFEQMTYAYPAVAKKLLQKIQGQPLYTTDSSAFGLSLSATIDTLRLTPLSTPPANWDYGFIFTTSKDQQLGQLIEVYPLMKNHNIYLYCRGLACKNLFRISLDQTERVDFRASERSISGICEHRST